MADLLHHNSGVLIPRDEYEELTEALATVYRIGARFTPRLIERLDDVDGDPDAETQALEDDDTPMPKEIDFGPGCDIADRGENAWIEWDQMRGSQKSGPNIAQPNEGDEEDDPSGQESNEDEPRGHINGFADAGAGCPIADPGGCEHDGREPDEGI